MTNKNHKSALENKIIVCHVCQKPNKYTKQNPPPLKCSRCAAKIEPRKPESFQRTWAFLIAALIFYIPANIYPIMTFSSFGNTRQDTIISGVNAFIESGMKKNVLIIGAETYTSILDYTDRATCFIFGDGAGAAIISATDNKEEAIVDVNCSSDGNYDDLIKTPGGGSKHPCSQEVLDQKMACIRMKGNETFKLAVKTLTADVEVMMEKHGITNADINHFIPHQANYRIISAVGKALGLNDEQTVVTVDKYGNTSAASIPMAMNYAYEQGKIKAGDTILFDAFGAGLTWGSALFPFAPKQ